MFNLKYKIKEQNKDNTSRFCSFYKFCKNSILTILIFNFNNLALAVSPMSIQELLLKPSSIINIFLYIFLTYKAIVAWLDFIVGFSPDTLVSAIWKPAMFSFLLLHWETILSSFGITL